MFFHRVTYFIAGSISAIGVTQRRHNHDRWYDSTLVLDANDYKITGESPVWMWPNMKTQEGTGFSNSLLPHIDFASSYECFLFDADRLNHMLNRKELRNEIETRLLKQSNALKRVQQQLVKSEKPSCAEAEKIENTMIARIFHEEYVQAGKDDSEIHFNELDENNPNNVLSGNSRNPLREKTRWNVNTKLHPASRAEIQARLMTRLPEKYQLVYFDDFQTVAANDPKAREEMLKIISDVKEMHSAEAKEYGFEKDLEETVAELLDDVDPTRNISKEAIENCSDLDKLEEWAHKVHEYTGDERILDIYERAAVLTKNTDHQALVNQLREWKKFSVIQ